MGLAISLFTSRCVLKYQDKDSSNAD